jgi:pyruvate dehydrogenase E2 component (dihydrolipoamide acetyltransferase)
MAFSITIPRLGWSMEQGTFVRWLKKDGDIVRPGDAVFELEGEKAAQDIEAVDSGMLRIPSDAPKPGSIVTVGSVIGFLVAEGEAAPHAIGSNSSDCASQSTPKATSTLVIDPLTTFQSDERHEKPAASPSVRRLARERGVSLTTLEGSGPSGRIMAEDIRSISTGNVTQTQVFPSKVASPRARRVANEMGIDWRQLQGTGRDGRVRESDVRTARPKPDQAAGSAVVPVTSRRRTIANRMIASREQTAPVTLTTHLDATNLVGLRTQFKQAANGSIVPSYSDIIIKLVSLALRQHPLLAARSEGDQWVIPSMSDGLHIGLAVDTEAGLVVPVVRDVGSIGLFELAKQTVALIEKSRAGTLAITEMQGGTFTITNLGSFGIDVFTPIINLPETAVLGVGRIRREAVVVDDKIVARDQLTLSLTFDHRIVDGAPAARFLQTVSQAIENPSAWLLRSNG